MFRGGRREEGFLAGYYREDKLVAAVAVAFDREIAVIGEALRAGRNIPAESLVGEAL